MDFDDYIQKCVIKILRPRNRFGGKPEHEIQGTGFWILPDGYCLTCYHVIIQKGMTPNSVDIEYDNKLLKASLCPELSNPDGDIAILKVIDREFSPIYVAPLGSAETNAEVSSYGYRPGRFSEGYTMHGKLRIGQSIANVGEVFNFETKLSDKSVKGMSGAPVYDRARRIVVGIQYAEEFQGPVISYVHPIRKVYDSWPELEAENASMLVAKLYRLEQATGQALEEEFRKFKLEILYPEREADRLIRKKLFHLISSRQSAPYGWIVIGEAGVGKSTLLFRLVEWCQDNDGFLPIWLDRNLLYKNGEKLCQFLDCPSSDWGLRLQEFASFAQKRIVVFVDSLDVILPHTDATKLVSQLNELAANAILICSSRPSEYERLRDAGTPIVEEIELDQLLYSQVTDILKQARNDYRVRVEDLHPKLIEMCQNPFVLYLLLEISRTGPLPYISDPTDTWVREEYWRRRVERVRPQTFVGYRFGRMSKYEVGHAKANIAFKIAERMLESQTYQLAIKTIEDTLEETELGETNHQDSTKRAIYQELDAEGVIRGRNLSDEQASVSFLHDSFAEFVICKQILTSHNWQSQVGWLLENISSPFYIPVVVRLVLQARDMGQSEIEGKIYDNMVNILENKRQDQIMMNRSWGVTYALHQLAPVWVERLCMSLKEHCPQEAASSIASVLQDVGRPEIVVPTLINGMTYYELKKRFIDGLGAYADPSAVEPLLTLLDYLLSTRKDDELLETIAVALGKISDAGAQQLLTKLESDKTVPLAARRAARDALRLITNLAEYTNPIPFTDEETIERLRILDKTDPSRYSDWKMVKQTADRIEFEARQGKDISPAVVEALVKALYHEHEDAQHAVVKALTLAESERAIRGLVTKILNSQTPDATRDQIVESFTEIATRSNLDLHNKEHIINILTSVAHKDPNPQVRRSASEALKTLN